MEPTPDPISTHFFFLISIPVRNRNYGTRQLLSMKAGYDSFWGSRSGVVLGRVLDFRLRVNRLGKILGKCS